MNAQRGKHLLPNTGYTAVFLTINKQKMSKSLGNHIRVRDALAEWPAEVLRLAFLERHYRSPSDFSQEGFKQALARLTSLYTLLARIEEIANLPLPNSPN